jgi:hypothetical protein
MSNTPLLVLAVLLGVVGLVNYHLYVVQRETAMSAVDDGVREGVLQPREREPQQVRMHEVKKEDVAQKRINVLLFVVGE